MGDITEVTGFILSSMPIGDFDRRIVILTKERGKIAAFAKGARRPNSPLTGKTRALVFGTFQMYEGRTSYTVRQAEITNYFEEVVQDYDAVCYACYFAELADYYGREGLDGSIMINLLYAAMRALERKRVKYPIIRRIYELKLVEINGECPDFFSCEFCGQTKKNIKIFDENSSTVLCGECCSKAVKPLELQPACIYALQYVVASPLEKLFTFNLDDDVYQTFAKVISDVMFKTVEKKMKSEEMLSDDL